MEDDLDELRRRLDTLETLPRAVFLLHRIDDLDYGEIGYRLGRNRRAARYMTPREHN